MARARLQIFDQDTAGNRLTTRTLTVYEKGTWNGTTGTPIAQSIYAVESGGSPVNQPLSADARGYFAYYVDIPQRVDCVTSGTTYSVPGDFFPDPSQFGVGSYLTLPTFVGPASATIDLTPTTMKSVLGSFGTPYAGIAPASFVQKTSSYVTSSGANAASVILHRNVAGDHATGLLIEVYDDLGGQYAEGLRTQGTYAGGASGGIVEGLVSSGVANSGSPNAKPDYCFAIEAGIVFTDTLLKAGDAPTGGVGDLLNPLGFVAAYIGANGFSGVGSKADAFAIVNPLLTVPFRVGFLVPAGVGGVGFPVTEAGFRDYGSHKYGLDLAGGTFSIGSIALPTSGKILAAGATIQNPASGTTILNVAAGTTASGTSAINLFDKSAQNGVAMEILCTTGEGRLNAFDVGAGASPVMTFFVGGAQRLAIQANGDVVPGTAALATNATGGFMFIETCAGAPSGTPTVYTGRVAMVFDTANHKIMVYDPAVGAWKGVTVA